MVEARGFGFECVSQMELERVLELFSDLSPRRLLFTPNFAGREEYEFAVAQDVNLTIDNVYCLQRWSDLFAGHKVILRIDPGEGRGHHDHVKTAGIASKFGIAMDDLAQVAEICAAHNIEVVGLHCHSGSGVFDAAMWQKHAALLAHIASSQFPQATILNLGGGLGVPYKFMQPAIDVAALNQAIATVKTCHPRLSFWMEPGRYVAAECGVLVSRVTQVGEGGKENEGQCVWGCASLRVLAPRFRFVSRLSSRLKPFPTRRSSGKWA